MAVKLGVIGCGAIAQKRHIPEAANHPDVQVVALCDIKEDRAASVAAQYGNPAVFKDYRKMLEWAGLDAVIVCTPNKYHAIQSIDALNAKKHVLVEKPMAATRDEAKNMIAAAKKAKKMLMVGQNQRLMPPHVKAKEILDSGRLGKVLTFQTTFKHPGPDSWSVDGAKSWFFKKPEAIMGVCGDLGVHKADLMRYLLGQEFAEVTGFVATLDKKDPTTHKPISVDDNAFISMKTRSGVLGTMTISWTNYGSFEDNSTYLYCEKGAMLVGADPTYGVIVNFRDGSREYHKLGAVSTNTKQVKSGIMDMYVESILSGKQPLIDGMEGYKSLEVILAAMESAASGKAVKVTAK